MKAICEITTTVHSPLLWFLVTEILAGILVIYLIRHFGKLFIHTKKHLLWPLSILMSVIFFFIITGITLVIFFLLWFRDDHPPSVDYHVLNAAIKNTCFLDPQKNHCPKSVDDLINIEPEHFKELTKNANLTYQYYPKINQYTLIVRNNDLWKDDYRVAIFDPRLTTAKNYGNGVDFMDSKVIVCSGKYLLINQPPFNGPWDNIN